VTDLKILKGIWSPFLKAETKIKEKKFLRNFDSTFSAFLKLCIELSALSNPLTPWLDQLIVKYIQLLMDAVCTFFSRGFHWKPMQSPLYLPLV